MRGKAKCDSVTHPFLCRWHHLGRSMSWPRQFSSALSRTQLKMQTRLGYYGASTGNF